MCVQSAPPVVRIFRHRFDRPAEPLAPNLERSRYQLKRLIIAIENLVEPNNAAANQLRHGATGPISESPAHFFE